MLRVQGCWIRDSFRNHTCYTHNAGNFTTTAQTFKESEPNKSSTMQASCCNRQMLSCGRKKFDLPAPFASDSCVLENFELPDKRNREYLIKQHDEDSKKQKPTSQNPVLFGEQAKSSIENSSGSDLSSQNLGLVELSTFFSSTLCRFGLPVSFVVCTFRLDILIWNTDFMCGVTTGRLCKYKSLRMAAGATNNIMVGHSPPVKYPKCENRK